MPIHTMHFVILTSGALALDGFLADVGDVVRASIKLGKSGAD